MAIFMELVEQVLVEKAPHKVITVDKKGAKKKIWRCDKGFELVHKDGENKPKCRKKSVADIIKDKKEYKKNKRKLAQDRKKQPYKKAKLKRDKFKKRLGLD